jgi:tRNA dimethylallyltransferase
LSPIRVIVIGGPTASGKSSLAMAVAARANGTVINADSMQIYDGLPLLTAQPDASDTAKIPHALYAALPPDAVCSAQSWRDMAVREIRAAAAAGRQPVVTGGTGFYIRTLLEGLSPIPDIAPEYRAAAMEMLAQNGTQGLFETLQQRDPNTAARIDHSNPQRLTRAMEVLLATGRGLAAWQDEPLAGAPDGMTFTTVTLIPPRDVLHERCNARFEQMLQSGAVEEAEIFRKQREGKPCALDRALGYDALCRYIDGEITRDEALDLATAATRQYAKRQVTWFKNQIQADIKLDTADANKIPL